MIEWIVTSSVLIFAVLLLRLIFKNAVCKRLQYALWSLVILRLLIPGSIVQSSASVNNLLSPVMERPVMQAAYGDPDPGAWYTLIVHDVLTEHDIYTEDYSALSTNQKIEIIRQYEGEIVARLHTFTRASDAVQQARKLWFAGSVLMSLWLLVANMRFNEKLERTRKKLDISTPLPVYTSPVVQTPCLFGFIRPAIYLPCTELDDTAMAYILAHEQTHYRHLDHIWALIRCVCLALHWYNPLVWIAAKVSRTDSELACDEGTLAKLGEDNRESYGRTLIEMNCVKPSLKDYLLTATTMTGGKRSLHQRIQAIAKKPKFLLTAVIALTVISLVIVGCTFTGAVGKESQSTEPVVQIDPTKPVETSSSLATLPPETTLPQPYHEDIMAVPMVRAMGMLYILDKGADSLVQQLPDRYVYLGICWEDNNSIPKWDNGSRHIATNTELYASLEVPDYIYYDTGAGYQRLIRAALVENEVSKSDPSNITPTSYTLAFFTTLMRMDSKNPYHQAAGQVFQTPEEVDLYEQFYNGFFEWEHYNTPLTEEENEFLAARGWGENKPMSNAKRFPISAMDERLQRFFGITFAQSQKNGLDRMEHYREQNQCYYHWRSDTRGFQTTIESIVQEPGTNRYHITYECDQGYIATYRMTLIRTDGVFLIYSNVLAI